MESSNTAAAARQPWRFGSIILALALLTGVAACAYGFFAWGTVSREESQRLENLARVAGRSATLFYNQFGIAIGHLGEQLADAPETPPRRPLQHMLDRTRSHAPALRLVAILGPGNELMSLSAALPGRLDPAELTFPAAVQLQTVQARDALEVGRPVRSTRFGEWMVPLRHIVRHPSGKITGEQRLLAVHRLEGQPMTLFLSAPHRMLWSRWLAAVQVPFLLFLFLAAGMLWMGRRMAAQQALWSREVGQRQSRLELLHRIASEIAGGTPVDQVIRRTLTALAERYPRFRACYSTLDDAGRLEVRDSIQPPHIDDITGLVLDYGTDPEHLARLRRGEVCTRSHWGSDEIRTGTVVRRALPLRASLEVSVAAPGGLIGLLCLDAARPHDWTADERATLREVAAQLGLALNEAHSEALRAEASARLAQREEFFRRLAEISSDWFWEQDEHFRFRHRPEYEEDKNGVHLSGRRYEGKTRWELPDTHADPQAMEQHRQALMRHEKFRDFELERTMGDGSIRYLSVSGLPVFDRNGEFAGYQGIGCDITERKRAELALRQSEETFAAVFRSAWDGLFLMDTDSGEILDCNPRAVSLFEARDKEELIGRSGNDLFRRPLARAVISAALAQLERGEPWHREDELVTLRGNVFWADIAGAKLYRPGRATTLLRVADVNERRRAQQALEASEAMLGAVYNSSRDALLVGDIADGTVFDCNRRALEMFEATDKRQIIDRRGHTLLRHPLPRATLADRLKRMEHGEILREDMEFRTRKRQDLLGRDGRGQARSAGAQCVPRARRRHQRTQAGRGATEGERAALP